MSKYVVNIYFFVKLGTAVKILEYFETVNVQ